jgi:hypothetical protein
MQHQRQQSYKDDDEASIDLKTFTDLLLLRDLNQENHVPDAVECSFSTNSSAGDSSESQRSLDDYGEDHKEDITQKNSTHSGYIQACGAPIQSFCETIIKHHAVTNFLQAQSHHRQTRGSIEKKSVRFAVNSDDSIKCTTMRYTREEASCDGADLWTSELEFESTCWQCYKVAESIINNHPTYVEAVLGLAFSYKEKLVTVSQLNSFRNQISIHGCARGLETSILAELLLSFREVHIRTVLSEQEEQRQNGTEFHKTGIEAIRKVAQKSSIASRQLARKLAENDTFEAVKAVLLPW